ncbi:MAG: 4Fe-4S binding protein [Anaerolineae bacterium]|nr:4Fe-4S binding protein [Anaerolineae bacterium]
MTKFDWMPQIDFQRCTGCNRCVSVCPTHALVQVDEKVMLAYPDWCSYCAGCEDVCPVGAIELSFLILKKGAIADVY